MLNNKPTLMVVGIGDLAGLTLDMLCCQPEFHTFYLAGRRLGHMEERRNLCLLVASQRGFFPNIACVAMDLNDVNGTAVTIGKYKPTIILNTASLQSWRQITYLPKAVFSRLDQAQLGPWLPMHLLPTYRLMQAVQKSGVNPVVVNAAFPDAVGPVLKARRMAPMTGIGNVANLVPALRFAAANQLQALAKEVSVSLFAQHYFSHRVPGHGNSGGAPFCLRVALGGKDVTHRIDQDKLLLSVKTDFKRTGGAFRQMITAASAASLVLAITRDAGEITHAPSPNGLPGGYPVAVWRDRIAVNLPDGISIEQAVGVNEQCQQFDGIDRIDSDGTVFFSAKQMRIMDEVLGYNCQRMAIEDVEERALELRTKYVRFVERTTLT